MEILVANRRTVGQRIEQRDQPRPRGLGNPLGRGDVAPESLAELCQFWWSLAAAEIVVQTTDLAAYPPDAPGLAVHGGQAVEAFHASHHKPVAVIDPLDRE